MIADELSRRAADGAQPTTIADIKRRIAALGYRLDRRCDCRGTARHLTGPAAGKSYQSISLYAVESDTGLSFANVNARRDDNFRALQAMRFSGEVFAVVRGAIAEL